MLRCLQPRPMSLLRVLRMLRARSIMLVRPGLALACPAEISAPPAGAAAALLTLVVPLQVAMMTVMRQLRYRAPLQSRSLLHEHLLGDSEPSRNALILPLPASEFTSRWPMIAIHMLWARIMLPLLILRVVLQILATSPTNLRLLCM